MSATRNTTPAVVTRIPAAMRGGQSCSNHDDGAHVSPHPTTATSASTATIGSVRLRGASISGSRVAMARDATRGVGQT